MTAREYWEGDRDRRFEEELVGFAKKEFQEVFEEPLTKNEVARVLDVIRAYARYLNPSSEVEIKALRFNLRGDVVVVTVTEDR